MARAQSTVFGSVGLFVIRVPALVYHASTQMPFAKCGCIIILRFKNSAIVTSSGLGTSFPLHLTSVMQGDPIELPPVIFTCKQCITARSTDSVTGMCLSKKKLPDWPENPYVALLSG